MARDASAATEPELILTRLPSPYSSPGEKASPTPPQASTSGIAVDTDDLEPSDDEFSVSQTLEERFKILSVDSERQHFFGKSSSFMLLQKAVDIRDSYSDETPETRESTPILKEFQWGSEPVCVDSILSSTDAHTIHSG